MYHHCWIEIKQIPIYLHGSIDFELFYSNSYNSFRFTGYIDVVYLTDVHSRYEYTFTYNGLTIS